MKNRMKKAMAICFAVVSIAVGMTSMSAGAYSSQASWNVNFVNGAPSSTGLKPSCTVEMYTYGGGYQSYCSSITGANDRYVEVTESGMTTYRITTTGYSPKKTSTTTGNKITFRFLGCSSISTCNASGTMGYYGTV